MVLCVVCCVLPSLLYHLINIARIKLEALQIRFLSVLDKLFLPLCKPGRAGEPETKREIEGIGGGGE